MEIVRNEIIADLDETGVVVFGEKGIGEKAEQFLDKKPEWEDNDTFSTPDTLILAQDFLKSGDVGELCNLIPELWKREWIIVRSSGPGDAKGTGIYKSEICRNDPRDLLDGIRWVEASYDSKDAVAFRERTGVDGDFGIIIQPVVGQEFGYGFAPALSGFGFTSTLTENGFVIAVPGMWGGYGEKLSEELLRPFDGDLSEYLFKLRADMLVGNRDYRPSNLLGISEGMKALDPDEMFIKYANLSISTIYGNEIFGDGLWSKLTLSSLFRKMSQMEDRFGFPQYFEWAVTVEDEKLLYWLLQIADVNKSVDTIDFSEFETPLIKCHSVTGSGIKPAKNIVFCTDKRGLSALEKYNAENAGYILVYAGHMCSSYQQMGGKITFRSLSNAAAVIEYSDHIHQGRAIDHFGGDIEAAGILFGVVDRQFFAKTDLRDSFVHNSSGYMVVEGDFVSVADEKSQRLHIYADDHGES